MLKCILGCGSKGRCFLGGAPLGPEMENREEDEEDEEDGRRWKAKGELKRPHRMPKAVPGCWGVVTGVGGAGVARGWLADPRKQRPNPPDPAAR